LRFRFTAIQISLFTVMRIRIRIPPLSKVMQVCDHWSAQLHFEHPRLYSERARHSIGSILSIWIS
jgi:hypothetical protein